MRVYKYMYLSFLVALLVDGISGTLPGEMCSLSSDVCYCNDLCSMYGDCCDRLTEMKHNMSEAYCYNNYYVIAQCPASITDTILRDQCQSLVPFNITQLIFNVPVYGIYNKVHHVYKNMFCATCNGKDEYQFARVSLRKPSRRKSFDSLIFHIPEPFKRRCYNPNKRMSKAYTVQSISKDCSEVPFCGTNMTQQSDSCHICNNIKTSMGNTSLQTDNDPIEIIAIDFNLWCLTDCRNMVKKYKKNPSALKLLEKILFMTFRGLSTLSLAILLFVYICIDGNQNRARSIVIFLALSLLILNCTNIFISYLKNPSDEFCFFLSIFYHYSFLSAFFWTTLFAVDIYQSLTSSRLTNKENVTIWNSGKLKIYLSVGFVAPLVFVLSAAIIQSTDKTNILSAGFGERTCLINNYIGGLVWFFIPLCISLFINLILCTLLYRFLYVMNQQTVLVRLSLKARKQNFILCLKLSLLMGFVCVPVFFGVFLDNYILKLIGGVISSLHGTVISLCFMLGARTRGKTYQYLQRITKSISLSSNRKYMEKQELSRQ